MAEIVNLRQARKRKQRQSEEAAAAERRFAFGRSKAERRLSEQERLKAEHDLESHRIARHDGE